MIVYPVIPSEVDATEVEQPTALQTSTDEFKINTLFERYSSFYRLCRAVAFLQRFIAYRINKSKQGRLTAVDVKRAETTIIRCEQKTAFQTELKSLQSKNQVSRTSNVFKLEPWIDKEELIRVSARSDRHNRQILLPPKHHVTLLIVREYHEITFHVGCEHILAALREYYWIPSAQQLIKKIQRNCKRCI